MKTAKERFDFAMTKSVVEVLDALETSITGVQEDQVETLRDTYGENKLTKATEVPLWKKIYESIINPFTVILLVIAVISLMTNVILAKPGEEDPTTSIIIVVLVLISGGIRFVQELKSDKAASNLSSLIVNTATVIRDEVQQEIPIEELVVGDIIKLSAGDMLPADALLLETRDFFIQQSSLTGESESVEKKAIWIPSEETQKPVLESERFVFMGSNVVSGSALAVILVTGNDTMIGRIEKTLNTFDEPTSFEKEMNTISWLLIRLMLVLVPVVFVINGLTDSDWLEAGVFALSVAVGLTPEMLPMIITASLAKGAVIMAKEKVVIKKLNAIQDLGAIDILCTDKTGTLTQDEIILEYPLDIHANLDLGVLKIGYLNSYFQTGLKNLLDRAIITRTEKESVEHEDLRDLSTRYQKIDELPFDFERRRMSVIVKEESQEGALLVTKGALEEMLSISSHVQDGKEIHPITEEIRQNILEAVSQLNEQGLRVLGVSQKFYPNASHRFAVEDESNMILMGYLAFLDPPKPSAAPAIQALKEHGVLTKILTGDNEKVTQTVCERVGLPVDHILLGTDIEEMDDATLAIEAEKTTIFAKLSPEQKARIIRLLKANGHKVGYMGDGINDAPSLKVADVGISVDTAVDIAKEVADVILLDKDLLVLEKGLIEGRKVYANMTKYIKMTVSSNFGNIFSLLFASVFLPFLPMAPVHLIVLNLIYDLSCVALPFDHVDEDFLKEPRAWTAKSITRFMSWLGPTSSIFDIITFAVMFFGIAPMITGSSYAESTNPAFFLMVFQTGWFIQSMWSQTMVIYMLRSPKLPFIQSKPAFSLLVTSLFALFIVTVLPYTPLAASLKLATLNGMYFLALMLITVSYMLLVTIVKKVYIKKYREWL
ncbi:magnesium-translocating P-type ATPase [Granulicatella elegans]|uniref:Magnesium-transporting ATPase, P-type 1 n=1 Tax=Granulicatella elegans ATCC 700633 TaxID=626369 RepID=D0BM72_9LACT|nr:magnesium-translocating P-type ATPase [Granulicatella elegans]EEW93087.1 magnesium-translocating P-type ATPase [Granulicatella elegans ATCC 700633]